MLGVLKRITPGVSAKASVSSTAHTGRHLSMFATVNGSGTFHASMLLLFLLVDFVSIPAVYCFTKIVVIDFKLSNDMFGHAHSDEVRNASGARVQSKTATTLKKKFSKFGFENTVEKVTI